MATSTRKWRKRQKEYARRKRQATRRAEESPAAKQKEKERMNKLQAVFGLTAAQGFGPNIFSGILASSKGQQENYLTASLRKKRKENAEERRRELERFPPYDVDYYGSKLLYAVNKGDVELVKLLLQRPDTNVSFELQGNGPFQLMEKTAL